MRTEEGGTEEVCRKRKRRRRKRRKRVERVRVTGREEMGGGLGDEEKER